MGRLLSRGRAVWAIPVALGAALMYFFDSVSGRRRRPAARDRTAGLVRRAGRSRTT